MKKVLIILVALIALTASSRAYANTVSVPPGTIIVNTPAAASAIAGKSCEQLKAEHAALLETCSECQQAFRKLIQECKGHECSPADYLTGKCGKAPAKAVVVECIAPAVPKGNMCVCPDDVLDSEEGAVSEGGDAVVARVFKKSAYHYAASCVPTFESVQAFVDKTNDRFKKVCTLDRYKVTTEELDFVKKYHESTDPGFIAEIEESYKRSSTVDGRCRETQLHLDWMYTYLESLGDAGLTPEAWVYVVEGQETLRDRVIALEGRVLEIELALKGLCRPEEGEPISVACKRFGDWLRSELKELRKDVEDLKIRMKLVEEDVYLLFRRGLHTQVLGGGFYTAHMAQEDGVSNTVGALLTFKLLHNVDGSNCLYGGAELGYGRASVGMVEGGASVGYTHIAPLGDRETSTAAIAPFVGGWFQGGYPMDNRADEVQGGGEGGVQLMAGAFVAELGVRAGVGRATVYTEVDDVLYARSASEPHFVFQPKLSLGIVLGRHKRSASNTEAKEPAPSTERSVREERTYERTVSVD